MILWFNAMKFFQSEFFKNNLGQKSMSRLLPFMAFFPSTIVVFWLHTEAALSIYIGAYVLSYLGGKFADSNKVK